MLHGSEGRGRSKVFTLGRVADWKVTYWASNSLTYTISLLESDIRTGRISDERSTPDLIPVWR